MTDMFIRTVKARGGKGEKHEYLRLVETYRDGGQTRQRVVMNLGRKDLLAPHLDSLVRVLSDPADGDKWVRGSTVQPDEAACCRHRCHLSYSGDNLFSGSLLV